MAKSIRIGNAKSELQPLPILSFGSLFSVRYVHYAFSDRRKSNAYQLNFMPRDFQMDSERNISTRAMYMCVSYSPNASWYSNSSFFSATIATAAAAVVVVHEKTITEHVRIWALLSCESRCIQKIFCQLFFFVLSFWTKRIQFEYSIHYERFIGSSIWCSRKLNDIRLEDEELCIAKYLSCNLLRPICSSNSYQFSSYLWNSIGSFDPFFLFLSSLFGSAHFPRTKMSFICNTVCELNS